MTDRAPTLTDLDAAQAELARQEERRSAYQGNNPAKYETAVREAFERVQALTRTLKAIGLLARTAHEELEARLDAAFPKARAKEIVTFEKARYRRRIAPATRTAAGQVSTWDRGWVLVDDTRPADQPID